MFSVYCMFQVDCWPWVCENDTMNVNCTMVLFGNIGTEWAKDEGIVQQLTLVSQSHSSNVQVFKNFQKKYYF